MLRIFVYFGQHKKLDGVINSTPDFSVNDKRELIGNVDRNVMKTSKTSWQALKHFRNRMS